MDYAKESVKSAYSELKTLIADEKSKQWKEDLKEIKELCYWHSNIDERRKIVKQAAAMSIKN